MLELIAKWIQLKTRQPFVFPGLWDCWIDQENGKKLYSFTIITTRANALLSRIHDRMPVIYDREMGRAWLEEPVSHPLVLSLILQPVPSERLEAYEVSTLVNSTENDSPDCVRRLRKTQQQSTELPLTRFPKTIPVEISVCQR